jgi:hypothetical protein
MSTTSRRVAAVLLGAFVLLGLSGCVSRQVQGDTAVYTWEGYVGILVVLAGLGAAAAGWFLCEYEKRLGYSLLIGVPLLLVFLAPGLFLNSVRVDDDHFEVHTGWWWAPTEENIRFSDVQEIEYYEEEHFNRRGTSYSYYLECLLKSGERKQVPLDMLGEVAADEIFEKAEARGVTVPPVEDEEE